jgi:hypothetical protein
MPTDIKLKNSVTATNAPTSLQQGEVAINITDKKVWVGNAATTPVLLLGSGADGTFTNLTVSGVASFADGTVSLPSITNIGDTNTGIFFPAADTIAFTEGGVESMRIDSSGNVGIGASPSYQLDVVRASASTPQARVQNTTTTSQTVSLITANDAGTSVGMGVFGSAASTAGMLGAGAPIIGTSATELNIYANNGSGVIKFATGGLTERMRIASNGNVGIGIASPTITLDVFGSGMRVKDGSQTVLLTQNYSGGLGVLGSETNNPFAFITNNTERMRITSAGDVGIGLASPNAKLEISLPAVTSGVAARFTSPTYETIEVGVGLSNYIGTVSSSALLLRTNSTERMRIDSSGNLLVGTTTTAGTSNPSAITVAGRLRSHSGTTASIANGATVDIALTMPRSLVSFYVVSNFNTNHMSAGFFRSNDNGASSAYTVFGKSEDSVTVTSPSGGVIRILNSTGGTVTFGFAFTVISGA